MKSQSHVKIVGYTVSPSTRREWIEIIPLPPLGIVSKCLPPHGGSGLKCGMETTGQLGLDVSLHTEGVD